MGWPPPVTLDCAGSKSRAMACLHPDTDHKEVEERLVAQVGRHRAAASNFSFDCLG